MTPTREIFWNVVHHQWMYALFALSLVFFLYGLYRRYLLWSKGRPVGATLAVAQDDGAGTRPGQGQSARGGPLQALWLILSHKEILSERWPGVIHGLIFFGFLALFIGTCLVAVQVHLHWPILYGRFYLYYSLTLDLFGGLMLLGILLASYRRYLTRQIYLKNRVDDAIILGLLFLILVTGFLIEGSRIAFLNPPWETCSPIGYMIAGVLETLVGESGLKGLHRDLWWFHLCLAMSFIAYIPYSKLLHLFTTPLNLFLRPAGPRGALTPIDFEGVGATRRVAPTEEVFGAISPKDFTWRQLLDVDACMRCGRCDAYCPATLSQKPLSPQKVILDIRGQLERDASAPLMGGRIDPAERSEERRVGKV